MDSVRIRLPLFDFPELWEFLHFATLLAAWCITVIDTVQFDVYAARVPIFHFVVLVFRFVSSDPVDIEFPVEHLSPVGSFTTSMQPVCQQIAKLILSSPMDLLFKEA